jgi:hypothetical protein
MATTTTVIYPAVGFCGSTNCVRVFDKSVEEVRALGRTARERFDLAIEVKSLGVFVGLPRSSLRRCSCGVFGSFLVQSCSISKSNGGFGPHLSESKMDYYQPPTDHPNALEMERLQEQIDALVKQRQHLETLEYTEAVEIQHAAIEEQISFLRGLAKEIQHG